VNLCASGLICGEMNVPQATLEHLSIRRVPIREFYNGFVPPRYVYRIVSQMLATVPTEYSNGLDCVVLTNQSGVARRWRLGEVTSRKRRVPQDKCSADITNRAKAHRRGLNCMSTDW
jgi:hypothetical protein